MKKLDYLMAVLIGFLFLIILFLLFWNPKNKIEKVIATSDCLITVEQNIVKGISMEPLIQDGSILTLLGGYYNCHEVERGDVISYKFVDGQDPLIKKVVALGGDEVGFADGKLNINGEVLLNSAGYSYDHNRNLSYNGSG